MKVLVVGGGGREHAIIRKLKESPRRHGDLCRCRATAASPATPCACPSPPPTWTGVVAFAEQEGIDYVVVAPDDPLVLGMVDALAEAGIPAFGPNKAAAHI